MQAPIRPRPARGIRALSPMTRLGRRVRVWAMIVWPTYAGDVQGETRESKGKVCDGHMLPRLGAGPVKALKAREEKFGSDCHDLRHIRYSTGESHRL